ncbi:MAG: formylglycine-generating enzyme family protein [Tannerella sp.]|jgi:hypothetical protein|nr:formylglycine-generating enzyme family protein [Tannerella sp.]
MERRSFIKNTLSVSGLLLVSDMNLSSPIDYLPQLEFNQPNVIPFPENPESWNDFRKLLDNWRKTVIKKIGYDDALYRKPEFDWVSSTFNCYFLMLNDETFYDHTGRKYIVDEFLENNEKVFGRIDSIVLWHAYPRIGLDDRNQFDFYRDMPGGLNELGNISEQFHRHGIKVFIDYNPWDTSTRREPMSDIDTLCDIVKTIKADGIFLDTMAWGAAEFREKLDRSRPGVVLEGELALPVDNISDHHMSWAQWFSDSKVPGILRNKWIERRHIQHGINRWVRDRTPELHSAWMNGSGIMIWENIFGQWNGWNERDKSILRMMSHIQKRYSRLFSGEGWTPLSGETPENVYASLWYDKDMRLWTLVNRTNKPIENELLQIDFKSGESYYDLIKGEEIKIQRRGKKAVLSGVISPRGIGCFIAARPDNLGNDFQHFLSSQNKISSFFVSSTYFPYISTVRKPIIRTKPNEGIGMVKIPPFNGTLKVEFRIRECGFYESIYRTFVNGNSNMHDTIAFELAADLSAFLIDETPVTNLQYSVFLKTTGYMPKSPRNFLKHWKEGHIPVGKEHHPVVYVDLDDARAYADWAGKRLPTELEWQFAGQGFKKNKYPWGAEWNKDLCNNGRNGDTTPVMAYPNGRSVFGCYDMCGNTWEMTESEHSDGRNRFCILKGGSYYKATGSEWYFDGGPQSMNFSAKQLLMYSGIDRCNTVGFRCVADL